MATARAPLHPEAERLLRTLAKVSEEAAHPAGQEPQPLVDALRAGGSLRAAVEEMNREVGRPSAAPGPVDDIVILTAAGTTTLRAHWPTPRRDSNTPIALYVGGDLVSEGVDASDTICRRLAQIGGYLVLGVDVPLLPEGRLEQAADVVLDVIAWTLANSDLFGCDHAQIGVVGEGPAALLVVLASVPLSQNGRRRPALQVLVDPLVAMASANQPPPADVLLAATYRSVEALAEVIGSTSTRQEAFDLTSLTPVALRGVPATMVLSSAHHPQRELVRRFVDLVEAAGVGIVHFELDQLPFGFLRAVDVVDPAGQALLVIADALATSLRCGQPHDGFTGRIGPVL